MLKAIDIAAHRGDKVHFRENTLSAFISALSSEASSIEFDVHLTKDEIPVIYHDYSLNPRDFENLDESTQIMDLTLEGLQKYRFNSERPLCGSETTVPTLESLFAFLKERERRSLDPVVLHLEIKSGEGRRQESAAPEVIVRRVVEVIEKWNPQEKVIIRSFNWNVLGLLMRARPEIPRILLVNRGRLKSIDVAGTAKNYRPLQVAPHYKDVTPDMVRIWKESGVSLTPWTVNEEVDALRLIEMGVAGYATDDPARMVALVKSLGIRIQAPEFHS